MNVVAGGLFCLTLVLTLSPTTAQAREQRVFGDWRLYVERSDAAKVCFIASKPRSIKPANVKRGKIFLTIAHRPGQGVRNEIAVSVGYTFSTSSYPIATVGSNEFAFFTGVQARSGAEEWAWTKELDNKHLINAMLRGNTLVFKGVSTRGTPTADSYSLRGVTAAMRALDAACPTS